MSHHAPTNGKLYNKNGRGRKGRGGERGDEGEGMRDPVGREEDGEKELSNAESEHTAEWSVSTPIYAEHPVRPGGWGMRRMSPQKMLNCRRCHEK